MKNILLLYASLEGQTAKIAGVIRDRLEQGGARVTLANVRRPAEVSNLALADFDHLVFGASIHIGRIEKEMVAFINDRAAAIRDKPRSLFIVLMAVASTDVAGREASLAEVRKTVAGQLQVAFDDVEMIAGALMYTQYGWLTKWIMKRIAKKEGGSTDTSRDHEYTDWDQVDAFARRLAE